MVGTFAFSANSSAIAAQLGLQRPWMQLAARDATSSRAHQRAGAARDSAECGACGASDSVRGERPPRRAMNPHSARRFYEDRVRQPQWQRRRQAPARRQQSGRSGFAGRGRRHSESLSIRSSSVQSSSIQSPSIRHQSGGDIKSSKTSREECQQPEPGRTHMPETTRMRSFASPAARVLRSVGSRRQTGWRSARARLQIIR